MWSTSERSLMIGAASALIVIGLVHVVLTLSSGEPEDIVFCGISTAATWAIAAMPLWLIRHDARSAPSTSHTERKGT